MALDADKIKKAKRLGVEIKDDTTPDQLDQLIKDAEDRILMEKEADNIRKANEAQAKEDAKKSKIVLIDTLGNEVSQEDYFFPGVDEKGKPKLECAPAHFNKICGYPVTREDLIEIFNQVFKPGRGFLFYKSDKMELYFIIVPRKYATTISVSNESLPGDFQKHALSFLNEGSVNVDSLRMKLQKVARHSSISER